MKLLLGLLLLANNSVSSDTFIYPPTPQNSPRLHPVAEENEYCEIPIVGEHQNSDESYDFTLVSVSPSESGNIKEEITFHHHSKRNFTPKQKILFLTTASILTVVIPAVVALVTIYSKT